MINADFEKSKGLLRLRVMRQKGANPPDLPNVAPAEYMEFLLNNGDVQVPSFSASASKCEGVFETLNMITRMLLHKFINQSGRKSA